MKPKVVRLGKNEVAQVGEGKQGQGIKMGTAEILKPVRGGFKVMPQVKPKVQVYRDPDTKQQYKIGGNMKNVNVKKKAALGANIESFLEKRKKTKSAPGAARAAEEAAFAKKNPNRKPAARAVPLSDEQHRDWLSKRTEKVASRTAGTPEQKRAAAMAVQTKAQEDRQKWKDSNAKLAARRKAMGFKD